MKANARSKKDFSPVESPLLLSTSFLRVDMSSLALVSYMLIPVPMMYLWGSGEQEVASEEFLKCLAHCGLTARGISELHFQGKGRPVSLTIQEYSLQIIFI